MHCVRHLVAGWAIFMKIVGMEETHNLFSKMRVSFEQLGKAVSRMEAKQDKGMPPADVMGMLNELQPIAQEVTPAVWSEAGGGTGGDQNAAGGATASGVAENLTGAHDLSYLGSEFGTDGWSYMPQFEPCISQSVGDEMVSKVLMPGGEGAGWGSPGNGGSGGGAPGSGDEEEDTTGNGRADRVGDMFAEKNLEEKTEEVVSPPTRILS